MNHSPAVYSLGLYRLPYFLLPTPKLSPVAEKRSELHILSQVWVLNAFIQWTYYILVFSVPFVVIPNICFAVFAPINVFLELLYHGSISQILVTRLESMCWTYKVQLLHLCVSLYYKCNLLSLSEVTWCMKSFCDSLQRVFLLSLP